MNNNESLQSDLFKQDEAGKVTEVGGKEIKPLREPEFDYFIKRRFEENPPNMYFKDRDLIYETQKEWEEKNGRSASWEEDDQEIINAVINSKIDEKNLHPIYQRPEIEDVSEKINGYYLIWKDYLKKAEDGWNNEEYKSDPLDDYKKGWLRTREDKYDQ